MKELDLAEVVRVVWAHRRLVAATTAAAIVIGAVIAFTAPVRYTAGAIVVPQVRGMQSGGNIQGLAAIAGLDLNSDRQGETLSPSIYPMVVQSVPFVKELMYTSVPAPAGMVPLIDYLCGDPAASPAASPAAPVILIRLSRRENHAARRLGRAIRTTIDEKRGSVALYATLPDAEVAACVADRACVMLQDYITRFKLQRAAQNLEFVDARLSEVRAEFEEKQRALARFRDANRDISSAVARTRETRLENEYDLAFSIYSEMARQREQAAIEVKEDTPVFTIVEPVTVPVRPSAPRRMVILMVCAFLGLLAGSVAAVLRGI